MLRAIYRPGFVLLLAMGAAAAAMAEEAIVSTTTCMPVPEDAAIVLTPVDDSPLNLEIRSQIEEMLNGAGYRTGDSGSLELRYRTLERGRGPAKKGRSLGQLDIGGGKGVSLKLNLWSSTKDSVIGGRRPRPKGGFGTRLIVAMELDRLADRGCVWRGEAAASPVGWQPRELAKRLAGALVREIGGDSGLKRLNLE